MRKIFMDVALLSVLFISFTGAISNTPIKDTAISVNLEGSIIVPLGSGIGDTRTT